jgi:RNA polymerase sigma-70 factor (ECF subfamily)
MDASDTSAIAACQAGDLSAFDVLYTTHVEAVYRFLYRRTSVREVAEDLTSITFLKAMQSIGSYDAARGPFIAWLYRIARNALIDHVRSPASHTATLADDAEIADDADASERAAKAIDRVRLQKAMENLTPIQREIVMLRLWEGLSYKEIAEVVGKSEGNAKVIFSRAVATLRAAVTLLLLFLFPHSL